MEKIGIYACIKDNLNPFENLYWYCENKNIKEYEIFVDKVLSKHDVGHRVALEQLKEKIKAGEINTVIIEDIANISRSSVFNAEFVCFCNEHNCNLCDTSGMGLDLYLTISEMLLKLRENKKEEMER